MQAGVRDRRARTTTRLPRRRPGDRQRRPQQPHPHAATPTTYRPDIDMRACRFVWLGTTKLFDAFTFAFEETEHGWFQAHAYRFDDDDLDLHRRDARDGVARRRPRRRWSKEEAIAFCEKLFAKHLDGHTLLSNASHLRGSAQWIRFPRVVCEHWVHWHDGARARSRRADGRRRAHRALLDRLGHQARAGGRDRAGALHRRASRRPRRRARSTTRTCAASRCCSIQNAARNSTEWFEHVDRYVDLQPEQFAYSLLTRSQRISHENLRLRDARLRRRLRGLDRRRARGMPRAPAPKPSVPPMFTPFTLRGVTLKNRIVVSPMAQYSRRRRRRRATTTSCTSARARMGGAGAGDRRDDLRRRPKRRITPGCPGLWNAAQRDAWKRIVDFVHAQQRREDRACSSATPAPRARRAWPGKASTSRSTDGNWPLVSASPQQYLDGVSDWSRAMTRADMDRVRDDFVALDRAARPRPASTGSSCTARTATCSRRSSRR